MKKPLLTVCSFLMVLMIFAPGSFAQSAKTQDSSDNVIDIIKPYVEVSDEGELQFKNVPEDIYNKYDLADLQRHFNELNALAQEGSIVINEDLSIDNNAITPQTVYGYGLIFGGDMIVILIMNKL